MTPPRRSTFSRYLRHLAYSESLAMRHLSAHHSKMPPHRPLEIDMAEWEAWKVSNKGMRRRARAAVQ